MEVMLPGYSTFQYDARDPVVRNSRRLSLVSIAPFAFIFPTHNPIA
jgi:hypothetical protein